MSADVDDRPDDGEVAQAAERAQWERARLVREQQAAEAQQRAEDRAGAAVPASADGTSKRFGLIAALVAVAFIVVVVVMLVAIRHRSNEQPSWVAELGLDTGSTAAGQAPQRLGTPGSGSAPATGGAPTSSTSLPVSRRSRSTRRRRSTRRVTTSTTSTARSRALEGWLLTHPQPDRVAEIYQQGSAPYADLVDQLTQLKNAHQTLHVENYRIVGVTVDSRPSPDRVNLRYADTYTDAVTIADGTGAVVSRAPYDGRARLWTLTLQRGDDGRWRVAATAFVQYGAVVPPG